MELNFETLKVNNKNEEASPSNLNEEETEDEEEMCYQHSSLVDARRQVKQ